MYCYIYDDFVQERKFEKELAEVEARITDLGLQGKIVRLALFRHPEELIRDDASGGIKTVVVVGNDATVGRVADAVVDCGATLGIIPMGEPNVLAQMFGVPHGVEACDVLAKRNIERIDAGRINGKRFLTGVRFPSARAVVRHGRAFDVATVRKGEVEIRNLSVGVPRSTADVACPTDGILEVVIRTPVARRFRKQIVESRLPLKAFDVLFEEPVRVESGGVLLEGDQFHVTTETAVLSVIVGRDRLF